MRIDPFPGAPAARIFEHDPGEVWHAWNQSQRPLILDPTVYEEDEPQGFKSPILKPDGSPIIYGIKSEKQGFIGFVDMRSDDEKEEHEDDSED